jgi:hypothetical protein
VNARDYGRLPAIERDRRDDYLHSPEGRALVCAVVLAAKIRRGAPIPADLSVDAAKYAEKARTRDESRDDRPITRRRWRNREPRTPAAVRRPE